jgi:predicted porin
MKKTQFALAALALVASTAAFADGMTVYGAIDASLTKATGASTAMDGSGNWQGSIFGFKGSEDLDGGLKATVDLEFGYNASNGTMANGGTIPDQNAAAAAQGIFNRLSNVGLAGDFGTVKLGQQLNTYIGAALGGIVNANESLYVPMLFVSSGGAGAGVAAGGTAGGFFTPNAVSYSTPSMGGLSATVMQQIQGAGTTADNAKSAAVSYTVADVRVTGGYLDRETVGKNMSLTANTAIASVNVGATYITFEPTGGTKINTYALHGSIPVADKLALSVNYVKNNQTDAQSITNGGLQYNLSKTTYLYGTISRATNGAFSLYSGGQSAVGTPNTGYAVGMVKNF